MNDIETLVAREKIKTQLYLYCTAIDSGDWASVRSCFADEHVHQHNAFTGSADEFIGFASRTMSNVKASQHCLSNLVVSFSEDGLAANSEVYFNAIHVIEAQAIPKMHFDAEAGLGRDSQGQPQDTDWLVAGTYRDRWVFRDGGWLIIQRNANHCWERIEACRR